MSAKDKEIEASVGCVVMILAVLVLPLIYFWWGYVFCQLWNWFAVPFFDAKAMTVPFAVGIATLVRLLISKIPPRSGNKDEDSGISSGAKDLIYGVAMGVLNPATALLVGYVAMRCL